MYDKKFKVENLSDIFIVISSKGKTIGLPPKSEVEVIAKNLDEITIPNKELVKISPTNENEQYIEMENHFIKVDMKGKLISGEFIKIEKEDLLGNQIKKLENSIKNANSKIQNQINDASKILTEATTPKKEEVEKPKEEVKTTPKKEEVEKPKEEVKEEKPTPKRRGRKPATEKENK